MIINIQWFPAIKTDGYSKDYFELSIPVIECHVVTQFSHLDSYHYETWLCYGAMTSLAFVDKTASLTYLSASERKYLFLYNEKCSYPMGKFSYVSIPTTISNLIPILSLPGIN